MKIYVTMKTPDALDEAIKEAVDEEIDSTMPENECEDIAKRKIKDAKDLAETWFEYEEYITVEIDTETKTCIVIPK